MNNLRLCPEAKFALAGALLKQASVLESVNDGAARGSAMGLGAGGIYHALIGSTGDLIEDIGQRAVGNGPLKNLNTRAFARLGKGSLAGAGVGTLVGLISALLQKRKGGEIPMDKQQALNPMVKLAAASLVMQYARPDLFEKQAMQVAKAFGGAALNHAKSWVPRMWGGTAKFLGAGLKSVASPGGKMETAGNWLTTKGDDMLNYGRKALADSRQQLWELTGKNVDPMDVHRAVLPSVLKWQAANPGKAMPEAIKQELLHRARKGVSGGYSAAGKALGATAVGGLMAAGTGAEALANQVPYVGKPVGKAINYTINTPFAVAGDLAGKLLDPGAQHGANRAMEEMAQRSPVMMQQILSQMPAMARLQYFLNPQVFNKYLTPELIRALIAQSQQAS